MAWRYVLSQVASDRFVFELRDDDDELRLTSRHFHLPSGAEDAIAVAQHHSRFAHCYQRLSGTDGPFSFELTSSTRRRVASSPRYATAELRDRAIAELREHGATTEVTADASWAWSSEARSSHAV